MLTLKELFSEFRPLLPCPDCRGSDNSCNRCGGAGWIFKREGVGGEVTPNVARRIAVLCHRIELTHIADNGQRRLSVSCGQKKEQFYANGGFDAITRRVEQFCHGCTYGNCSNLRIRLS